MNFNSLSFSPVQNQRLNERCLFELNSSNGYFMTTIKTEDGIVFHLGRPEAVSAPVLRKAKKTNKNLNKTGSAQGKLSEVEREEDREKRRQLEESHPDEANQ